MELRVGGCGRGCEVRGLIARRQGASLEIGACVLADQLANAPSIEARLAEYERSRRPVVEESNASAAQQRAGTCRVRGLSAWPDGRSCGFFAFQVSALSSQPRSPANS
ncbi:hypothetical protein ACXC9Q_38615 (plasmid) [Kribbella sp. CWNU-51]